MLALMLALLCGCGADEPPAPIPSSKAPWEEPEQDALRGQVLYASSSYIVVLHEEVRDRVVAGPAVYRVPVPEMTESLKPGDEVALRTRERDGGLQIRQIQKQGSAPLPEGAGGPHPLKGTVVNTEPGRVTVDHEPVEGVMGGMVMSFLAPGDVVQQLRGGDEIEAQLVSTPGGFVLVEIHKTGEGVAALREDVEPLKTGEVFPRTEVPVEDGSTVIVGEGQPVRTALTFLYTTCPDPTFCPLLASRLQALQHEIGGEARIVAITIDPEIDTLPILERYAKGVSAHPGTWRFGRLDPEWLQQVALLSGMAVTIENGRIAHLTRLLILDEDGTIIERYDDNDWPLERVAEQLRSGKPRAPEGQGGTRTRK